MSVINAKDFIKKATREIDIPGFEEGEVIQVRIKPLSLLSMLIKGKLPNELLITAQSLFGGEANKPVTPDDFMQNKDSIKFMTDIIDAGCRECLVAPTYMEIGMYLTDEQKTAIFTQAQGPIKQVTPSIQEQGSVGPDSNVPDVQL